MQDLKDFAYYYPHPVWQEGDWLKSLLLFFDGIAVLLPSYGRDKPAERDPAIALPLQERGLLRVLEAEEFIDAEAAAAMVHAMTSVLGAGAFDSLERDPSDFHTLSYSRLGHMADPNLAESLLAELESRNLARRDQGHVWMHPEVRLSILLLWAQLLRPTGRSVGLDLQPVTDHPEVVRGLEQLLNQPSQPSAGHVVASDLHVVGVDLRLVPLDEVLDFRTQYGADYRAYRRNLRTFITELSALSPEERDQALKDRNEEIQDHAESLRRLSRSNWKSSTSVVLGCTGAAWQLTQGDPVGAMVTAGTASLSAAALSKPAVADAYNFLFRARSDL